MSSQLVDPFHRLKIHLNSNGTITRLRGDPHTSPSPDPNLPIPVLTKDAPINQSNNTFARIFLPRKALDPSFSFSNKLPLIVYFHGGGFVLFSAVSDFFHDFCISLANDVNSIVVSVEYRLAPEHRLPAAYDDAVEALHWIKAQSNDWLRDYADYSNCYLMGCSAGANIAYHAALHVAAKVDRDYLGPLKIKGLILAQPFFGGTKRVPSETRLENDGVLPPQACDLLWELSLPVGVDRDHGYCNPTAGDGPVVLDRVRELGWRVLVSGCQGDPLMDRQVALARLIKEKGVAVVSHFSEGGCHGAEVRDRSQQMILFNLVKDFIASSFSPLAELS